MASQEIMGMSAEEAKKKNNDLKAKLNLATTIQKTQKMAAEGENAPLTSSIAAQLLEKLSGPAPEQTNYRPLFAAASPGVREALLAATSAPKAFTPEEERLTTAATLIEKLMPKPMSEQEKYYKAAYYKMRETDQDIKKQGLGLRTEKQERDMYLRPIETFNKLPEITDTKKKIDSLGTSLDLIKQARMNPMLWPSLQIQVAKGVAGDVGNISDTAARMYAGSPTLIAKAERLISLAINGTLPEADLEAFEELITAARESHYNNYESSARRHASQYGADDPELADAIYTKLMTKGTEIKKPKESKSDDDVESFLNKWGK